MIDKEQQQLIKNFLKEYQMTQTELSYESGIGVRTMYNALHSGKISEKTWDKIVRAMVRECMQKNMILNIEETRRPFLMPAIVSFISVMLALLITLGVY